MSVTIYPNERIDDLLTENIKIIQSDEVFSFSMDAVLLARFCSVPVRGAMLDLCTGNGVVPLLLSTRTKAKIEAVEIQDRLYDMAVRSVTMNGLDEQIQVHHGDLRKLHNIVGYGMYDAITVNPPYLPAHAGVQNINEHFAIARHEIHCSLDEVVAACARLVRTGGKVAMVHRPSRLVDIVCTMRAHKLEPKRIRYVHPRAGSEANMILIEATRDAKPDVRLLPPLIVYNEDGQYCDELMHIYYGGGKEIK